MAGPLWASDAEPPPDRWLAEPNVYPLSVAADRVETNLFHSLQAVFLADRLKVRWSGEPVRTNWTVTLLASVDPPGHWPARDWRTYAMQPRETFWETTLPIDHVDVPILYLVRIQTPAAPAARVSPMRVCEPRRLGAEAPTRIFWPFLDGFEEDLESWRLLSLASPPPTMSISPLAQNGRAALQVSLPAGKRAATLATTRIRGWQVLQQHATGVSLWLRAVDGVGLARFTLFSQAFSTNQVMATCQWEAALTRSWQQVNLPFHDFPNVEFNGLDLFTIEFIGTGPCRFLVDDLQLLGWWPRQ